jgi:hypothetical protein
MTRQNRRETGARELQPKTGQDASDSVSQKAAENRKPPGGVGNTEPLDDRDEKTRHSDGTQPPHRAT